MENIILQLNLFSMPNINDLNSTFESEIQLLSDLKQKSLFSSPQTNITPPKDLFHSVFSSTPANNEEEFLSQIKDNSSEEDYFSQIPSFTYSFGSLNPETLHSTLPVPKTPREKEINHLNPNSVYLTEESAIFSLYSVLKRDNHYKNSCSSILNLIPCSTPFSSLFKQFQHLISGIPSDLFRFDFESLSFVNYLTSTRILGSTVSSLESHIQEIFHLSNKIYLLELVCSFCTNTPNRILHNFLLVIGDKMCQITGKYAEIRENASLAELSVAAEADKPVIEFFFGVLQLSKAKQAFLSASLNNRSVEEFIKIFESLQCNPSQLNDTLLSFDSNIFIKSIVGDCISKAIWLNLRHYLSIIYNLIFSGKILDFSLFGADFSFSADSAPSFLAEIGFIVAKTGQYLQLLEQHDMNIFIICCSHLKEIEQNALDLLEGSGEESCEWIFNEKVAELNRVLQESLFSEEIDRNTLILNKIKNKKISFNSQIPHKLLQKIEYLNSLNSQLNEKKRLLAEKHREEQLNEQRRQVEKAKLKETEQMIVESLKAKLKALNPMLRNKDKLRQILSEETAVFRPSFPNYHFRRDIQPEIPVSQADQLKLTSIKVIERQMIEFEVSKLLETVMETAVFVSERTKENKNRSFFLPFFAKKALITDNLSFATNTKLANSTVKIPKRELIRRIFDKIVVNQFKIASFSLILLLRKQFKLTEMLNFIGE